MLLFYCATKEIMGMLMVLLFDYIITGHPTTGGPEVGGAMAPPLFCKKNAIQKLVNNRFNSL